MRNVRKQSNVDAGERAWATKPRYGQKVLVTQPRHGPPQHTVIGGDGSGFTPHAQDVPGSALTSGLDYDFIDAKYREFNKAKKQKA